MRSEMQNVYKSNCQGAAATSIMRFCHTNVMYADLTGISHIFIDNIGFEEIRSDGKFQDTIINLKIMNINVKNVFALI